MRLFFLRVALPIVLATTGLAVAGCVFFASIDQRAGVPTALDFTDTSGTGRFEPINLGSGYVTQVKHPDRYLGYDYITSQIVPITEMGPTKATALPEWPGRYVFQRLFSDDATGEVRSEQRFVAVHPTAQLFDIRGAWVWLPQHAPLNVDALSGLLDRLRQDGFNWVQYNPWATFDGGKPTRAFLCDAQGQLLSPGCFPYPTFSELRQATELARAKGFHVAWHMSFGSFDPAGFAGRYELWSIDPPDLQSFFSSYADVIVSYAALAQESGVELFSLSEFSAPLRAVARAPYEDLVRRVRSVYHGSLTAAEFTSPGMIPPEWEKEYPVTDLLDYVGMWWGFNAGQGGPPGPTGWTNGDCNPSVETMENNMFAETSKYVVPYAKRYGKPIVVMTLPYLDHDCFNWKMSQDPGDYSTGRDEQEGVDVVEASLRVVSRQGMTGFFIGTYYLWEYEGDSWHGPLADALRIWFSPQ